MQPINRRTALRRLAALGLAPLCLVPTASITEVVKEIHALKPGEFTWHPERSPRGAVAVVVSLPQQLTHVYRNGVRIGLSTCSTGKKGHETPTGVFTVLEKDKDHRSSTYGGAPMPNMNRLTWDGVALHAGKLPGYPASHGCVRLPFAFSERLWTVTHPGTPVIIAGAHTDPWELIHPGLVLGAYAENEFEHAVASLEGKTHPADWEATAHYPVSTVIASTADRKIELLENGRVVAVGRASVRGPGDRLGSHVFILNGAHDRARGLAWHAISHHPTTLDNPPEEAVISRLQADHAFQETLRKRIHPGMVMIITDNPLHPDLRSGQDFVIMTSA